MKKLILDKFRVLTPIQKKQFLEYLPSKVYRTERTIAFVVVFTQIVMILLFLSNQRVSLENKRGFCFLLLYIFLLITTIIAIFSYRYTYINKKYNAFIWTRRIYAAAMCAWLIGITYLEQMNGNGGVTYYYLLPTMAAVLLLTPIEGFLLFGFSWAAIAFMLFTNNNMYSAFGNIINSTFVTILTISISYRYYRSMAVEFCDHQIISSQYQEIEKNNNLLQQIVHIDQLTNLYNRHYLTETLFPLFDEYKNKGYYGMFIMIDIDYFKQYNDTYGHVQGDECLKIIAGEIKRVCTIHGLTVIRYGGEEFLVVKMDQLPVDGDTLANMLLNSIWELNVPHDDVETKRVSASLGFWSGSLLEVSHIETAIKYADIALYEAKNNGRNCVINSKNISVEKE